MEKDIYDDAIYQLRSGIEALDLINNIDRCLGQAEALSSMMMETSGLEIYSDKETIERYTETIKT
ncbi:MAG: hypothetical protein HWD59_06935 [Coxiellaceae bacterium]|nr:MAG: hypothetical protein HWD59_06935 [Coxiellaceae bacterium]